MISETTKIHLTFLSSDKFQPLRDIRLTGHIRLLIVTRGLHELPKVMDCFLLERLKRNRIEILSPTELTSHGALNGEFASGPKENSS